MGKNKFSSIKPILSEEKFHYKWIFAALALIMWSLLEEVIISSTDLATNFFADHITIGNNIKLLKFVEEANRYMNSHGYSDHLYSVGAINVNALAAATQIFVIVSSVLFGFCYGIGIFTAQYFGGKKFQHLKDLVMFKIIITFLIATISIIMIELLGHELIAFIIKYKNIPKPSGDASKEVWKNYYDSQAAKFSIIQGTSFIKIVCYSYWILALELALVTTLRETGRPMISFWASFLTFILTIAFLIFLVQPPKWTSSIIVGYHGFGIKGCAYAVILGKVFQIILLLLFVLIQGYEFIPNRLFKINKTIIGLAIKKTSLITLNELLWSFSMLMQSKLLSIYSLDSLTANAILSTLVSVLIVPSYHGISAGVAVLVGNNLGNNRLKIAEINSKRLNFLTVGIGIFIAIVLSFLALIVGDIFSQNSKDVIKLTQNFMWIYALATPFLMLNGTCYSIVRAGGLATTSFIMDSLYNLVITIPIMSGLILFSGLLIIPIFIIVRIIESLKIIPSLYFYLRKKWIKNLIYKL